MKNIVTLILCLCHLALADVSINNLPAVAPSLVGSNDVFPFVNIINNQTSKLKISQILSIPSLQSPSFTGTVTAANFVGSLSGHASDDLPLTGGTLTGSLVGTTITATTFVGAVTGHASLDLPLTGGTLSGFLTIPKGSSDGINATPSLIVGNAGTGMGDSDSSGHSALFWSLDGKLAMYLLEYASNKFGLIIGSDGSSDTSIYNSGSFIINNSSSIAPAASLGMIANGPSDGRQVMSGDASGDGTVQGGNITCYGHTHATKADFCEIYENGALTVTFNTSKQMVFADTTKSIKGTTTNDLAAAGNIGEYIQTIQTSDTAYGGATGNFVDLATIALTAGDWDVNAIAAFYNANVAGLTEVKLGISIGSTGNTFTDEHDGVNTFVLDSVIPNGSEVTAAVPSYRLSLTGNTTVILKSELQFAGGTPHYGGYRISARRAR